MPAIATGHNATVMSGCTLPLSSRRTRIGRSTMITVATNTNHGTNSIKLRLPVRLNSTAPIKPPSTLGIRSSHSHPRPRTPANWWRVRHTAVGYAKKRATALVASAVTGVTTSINKGKVISPPPPANALIVPAKHSGEEKQEVTHHPLFLHLLVFMLLLVCSGISAPPPRILIMQQASLMPVRRDQRSRLELHGKASKSTLPPVRIIPTRFLSTSLIRSAIAAYGTAADGSMTIFIVSQIVRIAKTIASSLTVTMSSTYL